VVDEPVQKRVDESWKEQVSKERTVAKDSDTPTESTQASDSQAGTEAKDDPRFIALISNLAMEGFVHLGDVPHPATNTPQVNLEQAKQIIDLLSALEVKTAGNLSTQEAQQFHEYLYQLRMRYVEKTQAVVTGGSTDASPAGDLA
jgi:hypothetical protein